MLLSHRSMRCSLQRHPRRACGGAAAQRRSRLLVTRTANPLVAVTESPHPSAPDAAAVVDDVLARIQGTDRGAAISAENRSKVDSLLGQLEDIGSRQQPRPLDNDLLFQHFCVDYVSRGSKQAGEPAGGRFRRGLGRFLFSTQGLYQSVIRPDVAINKVAFKLLGLVDGYVGLRGRVLPIDSATVKVVFEPPVLSLANLFTVCIGGSSWVQLTTTYLDERVRLGRGSLGSLFVFTRSAEADQAGMDSVGRESNLLQVSPPALAGAYLAVLGACVAAFLATPQPLLQGLAVAVALLATGVARVLWSGGQEGGDAQVKQEAARAAELSRTEAAVAAATGTGPS